jgi:glycosyltransferase involved in cell wall biosynthesis
MDYIRTLGWRDVRILLLSPYGSRATGVVSFVHALSDRLRARGHEVRALLPEGTAPQGFGNFRLAWLAVRQVWRLRKTTDLIHVQQLHPQSVAAATLARILGKGVVLTVHGRSPRPTGLRGWVFDLSERLSLRAPHGLVFVASSLRESFRGGGIVIPNGVDAGAIRARVDALRQSAPARARGCAFLFLGRISKDKGFLVLLNAFAAVRSRSEETRLVAVGPVDEAVEAEVRSQEGRLSRDVEFVGLVETPSDHLAVADVFVLPSFHEGLPISLLEAMAAGLPAVVTTVGDMPAVVRPGETGWLVDPGDQAGLESAMVEAASSRAGREAMGARASSLVASSYDLEQCVRSYEEAYGRAVRVAGHLGGANA